MSFKYTHTRLLVTDFRACFRFYRDVLGFTPTLGDENGIYAEFATGTLHIALFDKNEMAATVGTASLPARLPIQDRVCLVLSVEDVNARSTHLRAQGVALLTPPTDHPNWGIRTAHFRDPDGNLIEINQPL